MNKQQKHRKLRRWKKNSIVWFEPTDNSSPMSCVEVDFKDLVLFSKCCYAAKAGLNDEQLNTLLNKGI